MLTLIPKMITRVLARCILLSLPFSVSTVYSQTTTPIEFNLSNTLPTSPDAASLGRFGDIPISYYTGTAEVSVPLYTIKKSGVEIPIVLRYHGSGIKVEDQAGEVGLGWNLEPGGSITQIINGTPDGDDQLVTIDPAGYSYLKYAGNAITGGYSSRHEVGFDVPPFDESNPPGETGDHPQTIGRLLLGDGQPDLYQYTFGQYSGKFFIDPEADTIVLLDKTSAIRFYKTPAWVAVTPDGTQYIFSTSESAHESAANNYSGSTWKLTQILLTDGESINFAYTPGYYSWFVYNETYHTPYAFNLTPSSEYAVKPYFNSTYSNTLYLTQISSNDTKIVFNLGGRQDLMGYSGSDSTYCVQSIDVYSVANNQKIRSFKFAYDYFPYDTVGGSYDGMIPSLMDYFGKRLRLDSVQEIGYSSPNDSVTKPPYKFAYDSSSTLPLKTSFAKDFWGYYNGQHNFDLIPDFTYSFFSGDPYFVNTPFWLVNTIKGANRNVDTSKLTAGSLKRITYPTGGYTEFDYESNSFSNYSIPDMQQLQGSIKSQTVIDENVPYDTSSRTFSLPRTETIQFKVTISRGPDVSMPYDSIQPSSVSLVRIRPGGNITTLFTWQMQNTAAGQDSFNTNNGQMQWVTDITLPYDSTASYGITANLPDDLGPQADYNRDATVRCSYTYYTLPLGNYNYSYGGGIRLAGVRDYTSGGALAKHKLLKYVNSDSTTSSGLLMSKLQFSYWRNMEFAEEDDPGDADPTILQAWDTVWLASSESTIPYSNSAGGNPVGYSRVEEMDVSPTGATNGKHVYNYYNLTDGTATNEPDIAHPLNGSIMNEEIMDATGDTIVKNQYIYTDLFPTVKSFAGYKIFSNYVGNSTQIGNQVGGLTYDTIPALGTIYDIDYYPLISNWYKLSNVQHTEYLSGNLLSTTTSYSYDSVGNMIQSITYNSKGQKVTDKTIYPPDSVDASGQAHLMNVAGLNNFPLIQRRFINDTEVSKVAYYWSENFYSVFCLNQVQKAFNGGAPFTDYQINKWYPSRAVGQNNQNHMNYELVWSDDYTVPIAQITEGRSGRIGADYTSFEGNDKGNWNIPDTNRVYTSAFTGNNSYYLHSTITSSNTISGSGYTVSYWLANGSGAVTVNGSAGTAGATVNGWTYYEHHVNSGSSNSVSVVSSGATIDELRLFPEGSLMKTYTYIPLVGVSGECSPTNYVMHYSYDGLGRLVNEKDMRGNIVKTYNYHYKGQPD